MTSSTIQKLPLNILGAILSLFKNILFGLGAIIIKAPLASAIIVAMSFGITVALTNALFFQSTPHPAPLFAEQSAATQILTNSTQNQAEHGSNIIPIQPVVAPISVPLIAPKPAMPREVTKIKHQDIVDLQQKLYSLGFYKSKIDGFYGEQTADAIRHFQSSIGQKPVGAITPELLNSVNNIKNTAPIANIAQVAASNERAATLDNSRATENVVDPLLKIAVNVAGQSENSRVSIINDEQIVRKVQLGLSRLGFLQGKIDGVAGEATAKAIRNFEVYYNYRVSGVVSPELLDLLREAGAKI